MADEDPQPTSLGQLALRIRKARGYSQAQVAQRGKLSPGYVAMIETGGRGQAIGRDYVLRLAKGVRATDDERDEMLRLAGYRPEGDLPPTPSFVEAVNSDVALRADQKRILIDLYETLVR